MAYTEHSLKPMSILQQKFGTETTFSSKAYDVEQAKRSGAFYIFLLFFVVILIIIAAFFI